MENNKINELKNMLKESIKQIMNNKQKITPEIVKQEIKVALQKIKGFKDVDENIVIKRNKKDQNIFDVFLYGEAAFLVKDKLSEGII